MSAVPSRIPGRSNKNYYGTFTKMKIRTGFVSNSSSSSFIVKQGGPFDCPIEVAHHMLMERGWPNDREVLENLIQFTISGKINATTNLHFRSTNYDTFIYHKKDGLGIYTSNNITWKFPPGVDFDPEDDGYSQSEHITFTSLESGIIGQRLSNETADDILVQTGINVGSVTYCKKCYTNAWLEYKGADSLVTCPICEHSSFIRRYSGRGKDKWEVL